MLKALSGFFDGWGSWITAGGLAACLAAGVWLGVTLRSGADAAENLAELQQTHAQDQQTIADLRQAASDLQQHAVDAALAHAQANQRLDAIATALETQLERDRKFSATQRAALDALLATRPDLRDLRLGGDVLQHWNRSNQGPGAGDQDGAAPAAAGPAREPAPPVPGVPLGHQRHDRGADRQSRRSGRTRTAVPRPAQRAAGGDGRMAGDRLALVLRGGHQRRTGCLGLPDA